MDARLRSVRLGAICVVRGVLLMAKIHISGIYVLLVPCPYCKVRKGTRCIRQRVRDYGIFTRHSPGEVAYDQRGRLDFHDVRTKAAIEAFPEKTDPPLAISLEDRWMYA